MSSESEKERIKQNLQKFYDAMSNPCNDNEHDFEDSVNSVGKGTMLLQVCKKCFTPQGWVYNWHDPEDDSY
jgi:hypothetical protein